MEKETRWTDSRQRPASAGRWCSGAEENAMEPNIGRGDEAFDFISICLQTAKKIEETSELTKHELLRSFNGNDLLEAYRIRGIIEGRFSRRFGQDLIQDAIRSHGRIVVAGQLRTLARAH